MKRGYLSSLGVADKASAAQKVENILDFRECTEVIVVAIRAYLGCKNGGHPVAVLPVFKMPGIIRRIDYKDAQIWLYSYSGPNKPRGIEISRSGRETD